MADYYWNGTVQYGTDEDDYYQGSERVDEFHGEGGADFILGWSGNDVFYGGSGEDNLIGHGDRDALYGGADNDLLKGGRGVDQIDGGEDDGLLWGAYLSLIGDRATFFERDVSAGIVADLRTGIVSNDGYGTRDTMTGIESLSANTNHVDKLYGNDQANHLSSGAGDIMMGFGGDDLFSAAGGAGMLDGGAGTDMLLFVTNSRYVADKDGDGKADAVTREGGVKIDLVAQTLKDMWGDTGTIVGIENFGGTLGDQDDTLLGDDLANEIRGFGGSDEIDGRGGSDTISYADYGYDFHFSYAAGHGAVEVDLAAGFAEESALKTGTLQASTERFGRDTLANIENIVGSGLGDRLLGDGGANVIDSGAGNDHVDGRGGEDTISYASARGAVVIDLAAREAFQAASGAPDRVRYEYIDEENVEVRTQADDAVASRDRLFNIEHAIGSALADRLAGNAGANRLEGGRGNDALAWSGGGDTLDGGAGSDTADYSAGTAAALVDLAAGTGSVSGQAGADTLVAIENASGTAFADRLVGNGAANRLDGGAGIDRMEGGAGNDVYVVDDRRDSILDTSGTDRVDAAVSLTLADGLEQLVLTGEADLASTGNAAANRLTGNAGSNRLDGRGGADLMAGGAGNDVYFVDAAGDRVTESATGGTDRVEASVGATLARNVENLTLLGTGDIDGTGNSAANTLTGNGGDNVLAAGGGADRLSGGAGRDAFLFDTALRTAGVDTILDFGAADDSIRLDRTMFAGLADTGTLRLAAFRQGTQAQDDSDRILYDQATGKIFYDADGNGAAAAILFAKVEAGSVLTAADFVVVA
jgi:Ca2+-binding RTX toxin-like protein